MKGGRLFRKPNKPLSPQDYPAGVCVVTESGRYFIGRDNKRYKIDSNAVFKSWSFPIVVNTTEAALANYPIAVSKLGFRDGTLLNNIADAKLYLVSGGKLRHITSPDVLKRLSVKQSKAILVSQKEINIMKIGDKIS